LKSKTSTKRRSRAIEVEDGTLTDRAYRELEEMIVTLQLSPGTVLSEQALAVRLKIGRTPIREALQRLARDGLVVIMPRRGIMVSEINLRLQLRLLEVRRELERLSAPRRRNAANSRRWQKPCSPQPQRPTTSHSCGSTSASTS
jgi:DNA-binding GntR family transcriptional regulator